MTENHFLKQPWATFIAALLAILLSAPVFAIGLGEIQLNSSLNEPLNAEIKLLNIGDLDEGEILAGLAGDDDFKAAGVERNFFLASLQFTVLLNQSEPAIKITSQQPVREPYLDFLVELQWPSGRMLREYTLLLDLPVFSSEKPQPQQLETASSQPAAVARPVPDDSADRTVAVEPPPADLAPGDDEYRVQSGDTVWRIATKVRPQGYSVNQTMSALQHLNPSAFINNDINLLKKGALLRLPQGSDVAALQEQPAADVADTAELALEQDSTLETLNAGFSNEEETGGPTNVIGRLELAAAGDELSDSSAGLGVAAVDEGSAGGDSDGKIAAVEEELLRTQRENEELKTRLGSLEEQIETMRRMVEINDQSMRDLQQGVAKAPQPAPQSPVQESGGWLNYLLYAVIVILALALAAVFMLKNKKREEASVAVKETPLFEKPAATSSADAFVDEPRYADDVEGGDIDTAVAEDLSGLELDEDEAVDPEGEADIHLSLGSYAKAESLLKDALEKDPDNVALHLKLLEVFVASDDLQQFDMQRAILSELDDPVADAKAAEMRLDFADAEPEDDAENVVEVPLFADDEDTDKASLGDDLALSEEAEIPGEFAEEIPEKPKARGRSEEMDSSFSLDLDLDDVDLDELSSDIDELTLDESSPDLSSGEFNIEIPGTELEDREDDRVATTAEVEDDLDLPQDDMPESDLLEECDTKLDLADAYLEMGDADGAKEILDEVVQEGSDEQKAKAQEMLEKMA